VRIWTIKLPRYDPEEGFCDHGNEPQVPQKQEIKRVFMNRPALWSAELWFRINTTNANPTEQLKTTTVQQIVQGQ
jgi:hypothetical protein